MAAGAPAAAHSTLVETTTSHGVCVALRTARGGGSLAPVGGDIRELKCLQDLGPNLVWAGKQTFL